METSWKLSASTAFPLLSCSATGLREQDIKIGLYTQQSITDNRKECGAIMKVITYLIPQSIIRNNLAQNGSRNESQDPNTRFHAVRYLL